MRNTPRALAGAAATAAAVVLVLLLLLTTVNGLVSASDAVPLEDGVTRATDVIAATAAGYPGVTFTVDPGSADSTLASELRNNRSLSDHSDPQRFPGYNDCDAWRNLHNDGWSATVVMSAHISPGQTDALLASVNAHWQAQGYTAECATFGRGSLAPSRLTIDLGFTSVALDVDPQRSTARLIGTTDCLSPA